MLMMLINRSRTAGRALRKLSHAIITIPHLRPRLFGRSVKDTEGALAAFWCWSVCTSNTSTTTLSSALPPRSPDSAGHHIEVRIVRSCCLTTHSLAVQSSDCVGICAGTGLDGCEAAAAAAAATMLEAPNCPVCLGRSRQSPLLHSQPLVSLLLVSCSALPREAISSCRVLVPLRHASASHAENSRVLERFLWGQGVAPGLLASMLEELFPRTLFLRADTLIMGAIHLLENGRFPIDRTRGPPSPSLMFPLRRFPLKLVDPPSS
ncbi:hypothetical protein BJ546DRAFT_105838 [Cryomyces antarcticus]